MKIIDTTESDLAKYIPGTLGVFRKYDEIAKCYGTELWIRDTDHTYATLRYGIEGSYNNEEIRELERQLQEEVWNTCSKCGSRNDVANRELYSDKFDRIEPNYLCQKCYNNIIFYGSDDDNSFAIPFSKDTLISICGSDSQSRKTFNHKKIKAIKASGKLVYPRMGELKVDNNQLVFASDNTPIIPLGVDTGLRDVSDERVYTNDIIVFALDATLIPEYSYLQGQKRDYCWNTVKRIKNPSDVRNVHSEWGVDNAWEGFFAVAWRGLVNPIVVGGWHNNDILPRKIHMADLAKIDTLVMELVIKNIKKFEGETNLKVLFD